MLKFAQAEVLRLLLAHILKEKIEFATTSVFSQPNTARHTTKQKEPEFKLLPYDMVIVMHIMTARKKESLI